MPIGSLFRVWLLWGSGNLYASPTHSTLRAVRLWKDYVELTTQFNYNFCLNCTKVSNQWTKHTCPSICFLISLKIVSWFCVQNVTCFFCYIVMKYFIIVLINIIKGIIFSILILSCSLLQCIEILFISLYCSCIL